MEISEEAVGVQGVQGVQWCCDSISVGWIPDCNILVLQVDVGSPYLSALIRSGAGCSSCSLDPVTAPISSRLLRSGSWKICRDRHSDNHRRVVCQCSMRICEIVLGLHDLVSPAPARVTTASFFHRQRGSRDPNIAKSARSFWGAMCLSTNCHFKLTLPHTNSWSKSVRPSVCRYARPKPEELHDSPFVYL